MDSKRTQDVPKISNDNFASGSLTGSYEESVGDASLHEENALSACLMKILQKSDSDENNVFNPVEDNTCVTSPASEIVGNCGLTDNSIGSSIMGTRPKTRPFPSSLQMSDTSSESEVEKLRKWREAGVALRKALSEQSSDSLARTPSSMSSSFRAGSDDPMNSMLDDYMSGPFGPVLGDICNTTPDNVETKKSGEATDMKYTEHKKHNALLTGTTKAVSSHTKKQPKSVKRESDNTDISQGLADVREKIKKITSRISINTSPLKNQTSKPHRCARSNRLSSKTESSSSDSEDEIVPKRHKFVHKAHRTRSNSRSPKTNNTPPGSFKDRGTGRDPSLAKVHKPVETCKVCGGLVQGIDIEHKQNPERKSVKSAIPGLPNTKDLKTYEENHDHRVSLNRECKEKKSVPCTTSFSKKDALLDALITREGVESDEDLPSLISSSDDETSQRGLEEALKNIHRRSNDTMEQELNDVTPHVSQSEEEQEDEIAKKLRSLVNKVQRSQSSRSHHQSCKAFLCSCNHNVVGESNLETEPNLADIESSVHSGDSALLESEDLLDDKEKNRKLDIKTANLCDCNNVAHCELCADIYSDTHWFEPSLDDIDIPPDCANCYQYGDETPCASHADDDDTFECSHGDDLDDLADLDLGTRSHSEAEEEKIELDQTEIDDLPDLVGSSSEDDVSGQEADDEFECECQVCQRHRRLYEDEWVTDEDAEGLIGRQLDSIQYADDIRDTRSHSTRETLSQPFSINMEELTPLDLIFMQLREGGRQEFLELMFHNVIMQMLSVYPDLLGDQAPPPAPPTMVNNLPVKKIDKKGEEEPTCPICLCAFEDGEEARELPCKHLFHLMCIQMWLNKSGTCPVCRHVLTRSTSPN